MGIVKMKNGQAVSIHLIGSPDEKTWEGVKTRALVTMGREPGEIKPPTSAWIEKILEARHSPIRYAVYSYLICGIPSNVSTHLARHVHAQPYIKSLRNDRQGEIDGDNAPRNSPVIMIYDVNAEELQVIANKRLCNKASEDTRAIVAEMCRLASVATPEIKKTLVPMCEWCGGVCHEMQPCGRQGKNG